MNVLAAIAVLGFLILFHEAGHFLAARSQGILVNGFSIGFGPAIIKKKFQGVTYALRALPLGGFVSFPDEEEDTQISKNDPNLLKNRPPLQRAIVISAGVIANLLLAWLVIASQATFIGLPSQPDPGVVVISVQDNQAAQSAGLQKGDQITKINNSNIGSGQGAVQLLVKRIQSSPEENIYIEVIRNKNIIPLNIKPSSNNGIGKIGAQLQPNISNKLRKANSILEVIQATDEQFLDLLNKTINGYKGLFTDFNTTAKQMSGPVKIVEIGAQLSAQGGSGLLLFAALISINLAVLNSFPFPLLDGGQLAILLIESIRGKPIPERIQIAFTQSGLLLLVGLSVVLIIRDTTQLSMVQEFMSR
tara:strand:+ start:1102 stop:2184 length:1083 start_codon:yes stop_codon:yes gene_type:complete